MAQLLVGLPQWNLVHQHRVNRDLLANRLIAWICNCKHLLAEVPGVVRVPEDVLSGSGVMISPCMHSQLHINHKPMQRTRCSRGEVCRSYRSCDGLHCSLRWVFHTQQHHSISTSVHFLVQCELRIFKHLPITRCEVAPNIFDSLRRGAFRCPTCGIDDLLVDRGGHEARPGCIECVCGLYRCEQICSICHIEPLQPADLFCDRLCHGYHACLQCRSTHHPLLCCEETIASRDLSDQGGNARHRWCCHLDQ